MSGSWTNSCFLWVCVRAGVHADPPRAVGPGRVRAAARAVRNGAVRGRTALCMQ